MFEGNASSLRTAGRVVRNAGTDPCRGFLVASLQVQRSKQAHMHEPSCPPSRHRLCPLQQELAPRHNALSRYDTTKEDAVDSSWRCRLV